MEHGNKLAYGANPLTPKRGEKELDGRYSQVQDEGRKELLATIHDSVIGHDTLIQTPFGRRALVYADYTASGRSLSFIEDFIEKEVLPLYGNTHSDNSATSSQTSGFLHEARDLVMESVGGNPEKDVVLFLGSGSTAAIHKMVRVLGLASTACPYKSHAADESPGPSFYDTVVFVSLMEHHSNLLPWRHSTAHIVHIPLDETGKPDLDVLDSQLRKYQSRSSRMIGSFCAGSNVSGRLVDVPRVTNLLHSYGALSMWDYAAAAPYVDIQMGDIDAIFISTHKFVGGPGTPGVLVAKKALFDDSVCTDPGGGTVHWVTAEDHAYLKDVTERESGGTPPIIGCIRAGLVFQLKSAVTSHLIEAQEAEMVARARARLLDHPNIHLLGSARDEPQLTIFSFLVSVDIPGRDNAPTMYLHYNFITRILNDLFGIQTRGGCACAGPLGAFLLNVSSTESRDLFEVMAATPQSEIVKPGFSRLNFNYFFTDDEVDYILDALDFVAVHGYKLLPLYRMGDGVSWEFRLESLEAKPRSLHDISYKSGVMHISQDKRSSIPIRPVPCMRAVRDQYMADALALVASMESSPPVVTDTTHPMFFSNWRWFLTPTDGSALLRGWPITFVPERTFTARPVEG